jgi:hypothetical protein
MADELNTSLNTLLTTNFGLSPSGYTGSRGVAGYTGSDGYTGSQGSIGTTGYTGSVGFTGSQGNTGLGFRIAKSYVSVAALTADTSPTGIVAGEFALIETGSVQDADNSRLYLWNGSAYSYVNDLSGAAGITGPSGTTGFTGSVGIAGTNGFTGSVGSAGTNGFTGSVGTTGFVGSIGFTGSSGGSSFTTANSAPTSPAAGAFWYSTTNNVLYQFANVGISSYWIDVTGPSYNFGISSASQIAIQESTNMPTSMEYLVVAGGGSGSASASVVGTGGGGAGGYLAGNLSVAPGTTYIITVGAGGALAPGGTDQGNSGTGSSVGNVIVTYGGGRGGFWQGTAANGGSGGGGGGGNTGPNPIIPGRGVYPGSTYISAARQGYDGGIGTGEIGSGFASGGGGGGAGGAGGNSGSTTVQAAGGIGVYNTITGANVYYASGGTGGVSSAGSAAPSYLAGNVNTGGGGSGGSAHAGQTPGLAGGSGVVVFRYPSSFGEALVTTGSPTVTVAGGFRVYQFASSGSITI